MRRPGRLLLPALALAAAGCGGDEAEIAEEAVEIEESPPAEAAESDFTSAWNNDEETLARPPNIINEVDLTLLQLDKQGIDRLLPEIAQVKLRREGSLYWLSIALPPDRVWPIVRDFWLEQGFAIEIELPEAGVFETNWRQDRSKVLGTGLTRFLDAALENLNDTGERYRFRTRIERDPDDAGRTEVFISYRAFQELAGGEFKTLPRDLTLETEMLRRMMLKFRLPGENIASIEDFVSEANVDELYERDGSRLAIKRGRDEAWRRLLQGLDRSGFTVVAQDKDAGTVKILYANPTVAEEEQGFFSRLFGLGQEDGESFEADLLLVDASAERTVFAFPEGEVGDRILAILVTNI